MLVNTGPCEACGGDGAERLGGSIVPGLRCWRCEGSGRGPEPFDWDTWRCDAPGYERWDEHDPDCVCLGTGAAIEAPLSVELTIRKLLPEQLMWVLQRVHHDGTCPTRRFVLPNGRRFGAETPSWRLEPMSDVEGYDHEWLAIAGALERGVGEDSAFADRCAATWVGDAVQLYSPRNCNHRRPTVDRPSARFLASEIRRVLSGGPPSEDFGVIGVSPKLHQ